MNDFYSKFFLTLLLFQREHVPFGRHFEYPHNIYNAMIYWPRYTTKYISMKYSSLRFTIFLIIIYCSPFCFINTIFWFLNSLFRIIYTFSTVSFIQKLWIFLSSHMLMNVFGRHDWYGMNWSYGVMCTHNAYWMKCSHCRWCWFVCMYTSTY